MTQSQRYEDFQWSKTIRVSLWIQLILILFKVECLRNKTLKVPCFWLSKQLCKTYLQIWGENDIYMFFSSLHTKPFLVTQSLKAVTITAEAHAESAKPDTSSQPLTRFSILYVTHGNLTRSRFMPKVFAFEMCLWSLECSASFCTRCETFCICVQFLDLCVQFWKKEAKFWKCVSSWNKP